MRRPVSARIAETWFLIEPAGDGVTMLTEPYADAFIRANIWHVRGRDGDLLVDTGLGVTSLRRAAPELFDGNVTAVATHAHYDHTGGLHEFDTRLAHQLDAPTLGRTEPAPLRSADFPARYLQLMAQQGYELHDELLTAYPDESFDPASHEIRPAPPTRLVDEGDVIDLGDRAFEVLHLPGHTPGSIVLWESKTGVLFSGDVIYDGPILDQLPGSNVPDYVRSMKRLRELPVAVVHGGHESSFGRQRLIELVDEYLSRRQ